MHRSIAYVPAAILLVGCALVQQSRTQSAAPLSASIASVLPSIDGFTSRQLTVTPNEARVAGMTTYIARAFSRDTAVAFTTLVSYYDRQTQGKTIHSPRNCLPGAGWEIVGGDIRYVTLDGERQAVNRYVLRNKQSTAIAYYWYQGRGRVTANEYRVKWNLLRDATLHGRTEEALVRIIVPVTGAGDAAGDVLAQRVAPLLMREVQRVLPAANAATRPTA